ncbi:BLUF domain-containing protein [Stenotrophomonas rhizophila]|uniref:BLUF domain-containing protein n=1 Tax=Stenotrophomonas rhizophila TaxID=216778 RepID=UPI001E4F9925|nr:BLUF domain-containing protein [Stenotrophomonas rhizophila]MCC7635607.1 BLUF domain-containing protein [Stenotrophomonas rhizophila]MCC7665238.1 BLUF domain-containing protein [Stenotrophomonas rhizophila]
MPLRAIAYVSDAIEGIQASDIDRILVAASSFNKVAGVTGVLMFDGARFLQYFEGPEDGVDSVYQRVLNARSHRHLHELARGPVATRHFPRWTMASAAVDADVLDGMTATPWEGFVAAAPVDGQRRIGFARLLEVWTGVTGELEPAAVTLGS